MALRLGHMVICGELFNTRNYSVHGWIALRDAEQPVTLELTGNCDADLAGKHIRFEPRPTREQDERVAERSETDISGLAWRQIGPTGTMTAARVVKASDCPASEFYVRTKLGEPPPTEWKRCLYLEWYSQNGRVVVELVDPVIEFVESDDPFTLAPPPAEPDEEDESSLTAPAITAIHLDDDGEVHRLHTPRPQQIEEDADDDTYGLVPEELQRQLDAEAYEIDRAVGVEEDKPDIIRELELMDYLIEHSDGEPVGSIFDSPSKLPPPDQLDDEQAELVLKSLLAQLAFYGIALDVCEHFTPRDAYRLLIEDILEEGRFHPELRQTQWVQHFMTAEHCTECDAEAQRDFEEYERRRKENPTDDDWQDENTPC